MLLAATISATIVRAQTVDLPVQANVFSINPFGFLFEWYNIEYEHVFNATTSWSIGAGHINIGDDDDNDETTYTSADIKLRYYPSAEGPTKFSAGIAFGYSRVTDEDPGTAGVIEDEFDASRSASTSATTGCSGARDSSSSRPASVRSASSRLARMMMMTRRSATRR